MVIASRHTRDGFHTLIKFDRRFVAFMAGSLLLVPALTITMWGWRGGGVAAGAAVGVLAVGVADRLQENRRCINSLQKRQKCIANRISNTTLEE